MPKKKEETFSVSGGKILDKVKELLKEGNVRRIIIKDKQGKVIIEFPVSIGVGIVLLAPTLAAVGAIAALLTDASITVVREEA